MNPNINTYSCCRSPIITSTINLDQLLSEIANGHQYKGIIEKVRAIGKGNSGFDEFKEKHIPTYTVNATFRGSRRTENIISPTGLLYLDIDYSRDIDLSDSLIFAAYKSVSGTGITAIIKVENLTSENIKPCYSGIGEKLGIQLDQSCAEMARQTVYSYDPDISINPNSHVINASEYELKGYISPLLENGERRRSNYMYSYSQPSSTEPLVWNENHLFEFDGKDYILFDNKFPTVEVYIPVLIPIGKRHMTISVIINNLCYLNPILTDRRIRGLIQSVNSRCEEPLGKGEMERIFREVKSKIDSGTLERIPTRLRKIIFNPNCPKEVRVKMTATASGLVRSGKTHQKIVEALEDWDLFKGKITNKKLAEIAGVHINTLKKYLRNYPDLKAKKVEINKLIVLQ